MNNEAMEHLSSETLENSLAPIDSVLNNKVMEHISSEIVENSFIVNEVKPSPVLFPKISLLEIGKSSWLPPKDSGDEIQPYLRGCKWSPDGTCCLMVVNNDGVHVVELPRDIYCDSITKTRPIEILESVIHVKEAGLIYDFCWYTMMNSGYPETCFWITTLQNAPIQMWDAFNGTLRCSYRGYNNVDEMEPAISTVFSADGSKIIAGYKKHLRTFEVSRPGRDCSVHNIASSASCLAVDNNLVAVGSWNTSISLYSLSEMGMYKSIGKMHGHSGGVTHMKFTPDGLKLVSGARKDNKLLIWDIRYYRRPLNILTRVVDTNQRVYFDVSSCGNYLVSGSTDGYLRMWDSKTQDWCSSMEASSVGCEDASLKFPLHNDCCNSVSIHPYRPVMATGSGQYHHRNPFDVLSESDDVIDEMTDRKYSNDRENSIVLWWIGDVPDLT